MVPAIRCIRQPLPWHGRTYATSKPTNAAPPPPPARPYKPIPASERVAKHLEEAAESAEPKKQGVIGRLFGTVSSKNESAAKEPRDIARGWEASQRFVREGVVDPRYRAAGRRVTLIICSMPVVLGLGYELFLRRFKGKQQKVWPDIKHQEAAT